MHSLSVLPTPILLLYILCKTPTYSMGNDTNIPEGNVNVGGYIYINDEPYRATCNCPPSVDSLEDMIYKSRDLCLGSKIKVRTHNAILNSEDDVIYNYFKYVPQSDFLDVKSVHISSMDGRIAKKSFFSPGGDLGIFIHVLFVMFDDLNKVSEEIITSLLRQYILSIPSNRKFCHGTDTNAIDSIIKSLEWDAIDLTDIGNSYRQTVKDVILENHGDPYLKFLSERYRSDIVKSKLITWAIGAFFNIIWDKNNPVWEKLLLDIYSGAFAPKAIIEISVSKGCEIAELAPIIVPSVNDNQFLIYTEFAANNRRKEMATFVYKSEYVNNPLGFDELVLKLDKGVHLLMEDFGM